MRRFKTLKSARVYRERNLNKGGFDNQVFKVPLKYRKGRHKIKPFAVASYIEWINFGY